MGNCRVLEKVVRLSGCGDIIGQETYRVLKAAVAVGATKLIETKAGRIGDCRIRDCEVFGRVWFQVKKGGCVFLCVGLGANIENNQFNDGLEQQKRKTRG